MSEKTDTIQFDVLIRARQSVPVAHINNIESVKPDPEDIDKCLRWFRQQGLKVFRTEFGLSGETQKAHFESLFGVELVEASADMVHPPFAMRGKPHLPEDIAHLIDQLTIARPPELF